jgi:hypothetical protein
MGSEEGEEEGGWGEGGRGGTRREEGEHLPDPVTDLAECDPAPNLE